MKTIFRILVILVVAALIGGSIYALVTVGGVNSGQNSFRPREGGQHFVPGGDGGFRPDDHGGRGDSERGAGGVLGLGFGLIKNTLLVAVIALIYLNAAKWFAKQKIDKQMEV